MRSCVANRRDERGVCARGAADRRPVPAGGRVVTWVCLLPASGTSVDVGHNAETRALQ